jgi:radical SAM protein with 4Fe4S-binding SPASM domain
MPELPAIAELLNEIGSQAWQTQLTVAMGRAGDRPNLILQPYELLELFPLLLWIEQTRLTPSGIGFFPGNNIGYFSPYMEQLMVNGGARKEWSGCSAGKFTLGLEADGKIKGCPSLQTIPYTGGNLKTDDLRTVVEESAPLRKLRERTREDLWGFCRTCEHADVCKAGCSWTSHSLFGRPGNNPYCIHRALELEKQGKRERVDLIEMPPGVPFDNGRYELTVEPFPETDDAPTVSGIDLSTVMSATAKTTGLSGAEAIRMTLTSGGTEKKERPITR